MTTTSGAAWKADPLAEASEDMTESMLRFVLGVLWSRWKAEDN